MSRDAGRKTRVWRMPVALGAVSVAGLLVALFADGAADMVSIAMLSIPAALGVWFGYIKR